MITQKDARKTLLKEWSYVRETFFPRWDRKKEWRVKCKPTLPLKGLCKTETKTVYLQLIPENRDELDLLLIHETTHALYIGHGKGWQNRMIKTVEKAKSIGRENLAKMIKKESREFPKGIKLNAAWVYSRIYDCTIDCKGKSSFREIVKYIAKESGFYVNEFLKRFTKAKEAYLEAMKYIKNREKIERKFRAENAGQGN